MVDIYFCVSCGKGIEYDTEDMQEHDEFETCKACFARDVGMCEYCNATNVPLKEYDLDDGDKVLGCVDEEQCKRQMAFNEWGR